MTDEEKDVPEKTKRATAAEKAADPAYFQINADTNPKDGPVAVAEEEPPVEGGADGEPTEEAPMTPPVPAEVELPAEEAPSEE
jgi:hypothetical protein